MANSPAAALEDLKAEAARLQGLAGSGIVLGVASQRVLITARKNLVQSEPQICCSGSLFSTCCRSSGFNGDHPSCMSLRGALGRLRELQRLPRDRTAVTWLVRKTNLGPRQVKAELDAPAFVCGAFRNGEALVEEFGCKVVCFHPHSQASCQRSIEAGGSDASAASQLEPRLLTAMACKRVMTS